jgi:hypothetical protein
LVSYLSLAFSHAAALHTSPHSKLPFDVLLMPVFFRMCVSADLNAHDIVVCLEINLEREELCNNNVYYNLWYSREESSRERERERERERVL